MTADKLRVAKNGAIATLTLNQPEKRNAISFEMWKTLPIILADLEGDAAIRVVIVRGEGGQAFSAGNDISEFEEKRSGANAIAEYNAVSRHALETLGAFPKPTIAMIEGYCIGGGIEIALLCDLQIAAEGSRFAVPAAKLGLGYRYHDIRLLVDAVGAGATKEMLFTGRLFSAEEALAMGLVRRVVPAQNLATTVEELARSIAENAPLTVKAAKLMAEQAIRDPGVADGALCDRLVDACHASEDYAEGRLAFREKRRPRFKGR